MFNWTKNRARKKNKKRFLSIVSDRRSNYLELLFKDFESGIEISDEKVLEAYDKFSKNIQTNTISAAELEFVIVATIISYKPHLTERLLSQPLLMMVWSFGDKINFETVTEFVEVHILNEKAEPYGGIPGDKAMKWLKEYFRKNENQVQKKLLEVIEKNNEELEKI